MDAEHKSDVLHLVQEEQRYFDGELHQLKDEVERHEDEEIVVDVDEDIQNQQRMNENEIEIKKKQRMNENEIKKQ